MSANDRKISLKVKWFVAICIILALIGVTFVFIQYVVNQNDQGMKSISKWGVTINELPSSEKVKYSQSSLEEQRHSIGLYVSGSTFPPLAGQTEKTLNPDVSGVTEKDLYITYDVDVDFPNDSFTKDGFFNCPIQLDSVNTFTNLNNHINCKDYTSKTKLRDDALKLGDIFNDVKIPAGTNMKVFTEGFRDRCYFSITSDKDFDNKGYQNTKINLDYKFIISDEPLSDNNN